MRRSNQRGERGVALLVALFALALLSAVGMAMMYWADTETSVNSNYRDKQVSTFAALSGIQEARERLIPATSDLPTLASVPDSLSETDIVYIINPASGETVAPWNPTNKYADTELCQDNLPSAMGVTQGTPGTLCSGTASLPSGNGWYSVMDNSSGSYTGPFKLNPPLNYKWVRIQLKANNATPFPALGSGSSSDGSQMCWDGLHQIKRPAGYKPDCTPTGGIAQIVVTNPGSNYNSAPQVHIGPPSSGGTQATATANYTIVNGTLTGVAIDNGGAGYTTPPAVVIDPPASGTQATGTANISPPGSQIASLSVTPGNPVPGCYLVAPTVSFSPNPANATATAVLSTTPSCIQALNVSASCGTTHFKNLKNPPPTGSAPANISVSGGGSGVQAFAGTIDTDSHGNASGAVNVTNPGASYTSIPAASAVTLGDNNGHACPATAVTATMGYTVDHLVLGNPGGGFTSAPAVTLTAPLAGTNMPSASATLGPGGAGSVISVTLTSGGSGYTSSPNITFIGGCGAGSPPPACPTTAVGHALFNGQINSITVDNQGAGYLSPPPITFTGGGAGTGLTAVALLANGTYYAPVYLVTALSQTVTGARSMVQMELAPAIRMLSLPGALTMAGPQPNFGSPDSMNFYVDGRDHPQGVSGTDPLPPGCSATQNPPRPSIGVYDNPEDPTDPSSVETMLQPGVLAKPDHYPGEYASPDIQNVYGALGDQGTTPSGMNSIVSAIAGLPGTNVYPPLNPNNLALGSVSPYNPTVNVVYGDLTLSGSTTGYGVLVVTGVLTFTGNFTWNGLVLVIGKGDIEFGGGGGGTINGSVMVAKTVDNAGNLLSQLGQPTLNWSGGGGNGIYYDHCWADSMLNMIPLTTSAKSTTPLTVLSTKVLSY